MINLINKLASLPIVSNNYALEGIILTWVNKTQVKVSPVAWEGGEDAIYTPSLREYKWLLSHWKVNYVTGAYEPWYIGFED